MREARGYNQSIYLMVGMPYLLLGTVGFLIYRGLKQQTVPSRSDEGDSSCSTDSTDDAS